MGIMGIKRAYVDQIFHLVHEWTCCYLLMDWIATVLHARLQHLEIKTMQMLAHLVLFEKVKTQAHTGNTVKEKVCCKFVEY